MSKLKKALKNVVEQVAHFCLGAFFTLPFAFYFTFWWIGLPVVCMLIIVREFIIQWPIERWWDTVLDSSFMILGALVVGILI